MPDLRTIKISDSECKISTSENLVSKIKPVEVPGVQVRAFKAIFIYADDSSGISGDNVFDVLYAVPCGVLTNVEMVSLFLYYTNPARAFSAQYPLQFSTKRRMCTVLDIQVRIRTLV
uniref:ADF-H domain-containing protein n=1 Tax=Globodera pallida TaxID=36090 RepID=A0A183BQF0_GLOPA